MLAVMPYWGTEWDQTVLSLTVSDSQNVITPLYYYTVPTPSDIVICTLQCTYNYMYSYRHGLSFTLKSRTELLSCTIVLQISRSTHRWNTSKIVKNRGRHSFKCFCIYCKFPKIRTPPPFCTLFLHKSGEGAFARMFSSSCAYYASSLHSLLSWMCANSSWWLPRLSERTAASLNVYYGKSTALALILNQEAPKRFILSVVTGGDSVQACVPSATNNNLSSGQETWRQ